MMSKLFTSKHLLSAACALAVLFGAGVCLAESFYTNDFTKDMGKWKLDKAEGKVTADGLKITKFGEWGGISIENTPPAQDLSGYKTFQIEIKNGGKESVALTFKIGNDALKNKVTNEFSVDAGETKTYECDLDDLGIDLKKIDYVKLFAATAIPAADIAITKVNLVAKTPASGPAATAPAAGATTKPAATPLDADFTKSLGKWTIAGADGKQVDGQGIVLTNLKEYGGIVTMPKAANLSATPKINLEVEYKGAEAITLTLKLKSGADSGQADMDVPTGKSTVSKDLGDVGVDLKKLDYIKIWGPNGDIKLTIKRVWFSK
jgi:hypothetical protein